MTTTEEQSKRAEQASVATTNGLLSIDRELKALRRDVTVGFVALRDQIREIKSQQHMRRELVSLTEEDFEETDAGQHFKITRDKVERILSNVERDRDAKKWRAFWHRIKWFVFLVLGGGATFGGERLFEYLTKLL